MTEYSEAALTARRGERRSDHGGFPGPRAGRAILLVGLIIHAVFLVNLIGPNWLDPLFVETGCQYEGYGQGCDYFGIYLAGDNLLQGRSIYALEGRPEDSPRRVPYFFFYRYLPPTAYVAAVQAAVQRPWPAYWTWFAITEALFVLMILSVWRMKGPRRPLRETLAGISFGFSPFYIEQWMGQYSLLMAVLLWLTFRAELSLTGPPRETGLRDLARRGEFWAWSGAVALKNFPALYALPYLRQGRWRRVLWCAVAVIAASLPYYLFRMQDVVSFLTLNLRPLPPAIYKGTFGLATVFRDLGWRLPESFTSQAIVFGSRDVQAGNLLYFAGAGLVFALSLYATWRMGRRGAAAEPIALWTLTFFMVYKDVWEYHYMMALPVVWLLALRGAPKWPILLGIWMALPTPWVFYRTSLGVPPVQEWPVWLTLLHFGSKVGPVVGLYAVCLWRILRPEGTPEWAGRAERVEARRGSEATSGASRG